MPVPRAIKKEKIIPLSFKKQFDRTNETFLFILVLARNQEIIVKMFKVLFIFFILFSSGLGEPCNDSLTVDITNNSVFFGDGSVFHKEISDELRNLIGVAYPKNLIFEKNINDETRILGCVCELKPCFRKCCPLGWVVYKKQCIEDFGQDLILNKGLDVFYLNNFEKNVDIRTGAFALLRTQQNGKPFYCDVFKENRPWFMQKDGQLWVDMPHQNPPWQLLRPEKYCIDTFITEDEDGMKTSKLDALVCFQEDQGEHHFVQNITCMLISSVFILATCAVYAWLPELRNLHGRVLMAYLICLFVAFAFMATMQILIALDNTDTSLCVVLSIIIYFPFEAAFFWLNVMCFDIWWTFSGKRGLSLERLSSRARFNAYAAYAFGFATALTILVTGLEFSGMPPSPWTPNLRRQGCFFYGRARMIYLYGPVVILCFINLIFFILTAVKIVQIKKQTAVLKSKESSTHDSQRNDKQRLLLYVKLYMVMGVNWILEVISVLYPELENFWKITDAYNVLVGVTIFIIFVCKRKIFRLIKKRYKQVKGDPMSRTQTTISSRTPSTKEDIQMGSVKVHCK
ncbi:G-protein coupled receptor Mth2-like isoform X2 [Plodia interpunctella]|uniref:G-protein coupled receptor Mth2-like isoform X2 n=1 Tax=Plodia interpunctella TaxID=58824 RepID=UPI002367D336|nr:G-protein coupled receptor Mth2-like isoform X2 [Plodia interpunctella]